MHIAVLGAGQLGAALVPTLLADRHTVTVLRRGAWAPQPAGRPDVACHGRAGATADPFCAPGVRRVSGDVLDPAVLSDALEGADAVVHAIHAPYDSAVWRRDLLPREAAVLDAAAHRGIAALFPESMYAWGRGAEDLPEGAPIAPDTPLGHVRADLLQARAAHPACTISLVASDFVGPTASVQSVQATLLDATGAGRTAWVLGDPDMPHSLTALPDLAAAFVRCVADPERWAPGGDAVLHAPTASAWSLREEARAVARTAGAPEPRIRRIPSPVLSVIGIVNAPARELRRQRLLWERPCVLRPGVLGEPDHRDRVARPT